MKTIKNKILSPVYLRLSGKAAHPAFRRQASVSPGPVGPLSASLASTLLHRAVVTIATLSASAIFLASLPWGCSDGCFSPSREPQARTQESASANNSTQSPGLDPENPGTSNASKAISQRILFKRGMETAGSGNIDEAIKLYRRASEVLPGSKIAAQAHAAIGELWDEKGEHQRALAALSQAKAIDGKNPSILHSLALAYERMGKHRQAWETVQSAQALKDDDLSISADGARLALVAGEKENALELLEKFEKTRDLLIKKALGNGDFISRPDDKHPFNPGADSRDKTRDKEHRIQTRAIDKKGNKGKEKEPDRTAKKRSDAEEARIRALEKLAEVPDTVTARALWPLLDDPSNRIRENVAWLLGAFGYKESLQPLRKKLDKESNADVREAIKKAIAAINKNPTSFPADSSSPQVQKDKQER